jgi:hypothetical protein
MVKYLTTLSKWFSWAGLAISGGISLCHVAWVVSTPRGVWVIPRIRQVTAPAPVIPENQAKWPLVRLDSSVKGFSLRISQADLLCIQPGDKLLVVDKMFFADNQANVQRLTLLRFFYSYPALFVVVFLVTSLKLKRYHSKA